MAERIIKSCRKRMLVQMQRTVKKCSCGYSLVECVNHAAITMSKDTTTCPQCGNINAELFLYVDKRNLPCDVDTETSNRRHRGVVNANPKKAS